MTILIDAFVRVIVSYIRTNRARCALYKKILDLLDEESVSGESSGRSLYIRREVLPQMFEKVSRSQVRFKFFLSTNIPIYLYCIYVDINTNHFTPLVLACGVMTKRHLTTCRSRI